MTLLQQLEAAGEGSREPTPAEVIAELRAVTIAITMFGLDKLPEVMSRARSAGEGGA